MRDPSEVIAEMRDCERHVQVFGWPRAIRQWADELAATLPASTPPGDAVAHLNAALGHAFTDDPANACRAHAAVLPILQQLSTPQPASDEPCVRHACKRVRMEMQARIDALAEQAEADRADARRYRYLRDCGTCQIKGGGRWCEPSVRFSEIHEADVRELGKSACIDAAIDAALAGAVTQGEG